MADASPSQTIRASVPVFSKGKTRTRDWDDDASDADGDDV
jgi:hypothetical protein